MKLQCHVGKPSESERAFIDTKSVTFAARREGRKSHWQCLAKLVEPPHLVRGVLLRAVPALADPAGQIRSAGAKQSTHKVWISSELPNAFAAALALVVR